MKLNDFFKHYCLTVLIFWLLWWIITFMTDFLGAAHLLGWVNFTWVTHIDNYAGLLRATSLFGLSPFVALILYALIIVWLLLIVLFFIQASLYWISNSPQKWFMVHRAYFVAFLFWLAFFLSDQLILNFSLEENHMVQGGFMLLTWVSLRLLPYQKVN